MSQQNTGRYKPETSRFKALLARFNAKVIMQIAIVVVIAVDLGIGFYYGFAVTDEQQTYDHRYLKPEMWNNSGGCFQMGSPKNEAAVVIIESSSIRYAWGTLSSANMKSQLASYVVL